MTDKEANNLLYKSKWKIACCSQGKQCWCRMIIPIKPIIYKDKNGEHEAYITGCGELRARTAKYIVKLHNDKLEGR